MFHRVKSEADKPQMSQINKSEATKPQASAASPAAAETNATRVQKLSTVSAAAAKETANTNETNTSAPKAVAEIEKKQEPQTQQKETPMSDNTETFNKDDNAQTKAVDIPASAYGTAPRAPYPGSTYAATGYGVPGSASAATPSSNPYASSPAAAKDERRLVIGQGITMSGEIEHCDILLVEGTIEAALKGAKMLEISEAGTFYGTVEIDEAEISGRFEGDLTVNGRLTVYASGVITGSISYKELQIESGAIIDGKLTPLKQAAAASNRPVKKDNKSPKEAAALAKAKEIKEQNSSSNNDEGELFSSAAE